MTRREGGPDAGTAEPIEVGSISFADYDRDGFVDLFLGGSGDTNRLYRNNGDLTFTNVTPEAGVETAVGACGSVFFDYDDDGWLDIFVAGCNRPGPTVRNQLFHNNRDGTFTDVSAESGVGIIGDWMGVTAGDYDQDGDIDLFVTNVGLESCVGTWANALYRNNGDGTFTDVGIEAGVGLLEFGWGCSFADFDNDGYLDLTYVGSLNGCMGNPGRILFNNRDGKFADASARPVPRLATGGILRRGSSGRDEGPLPLAMSPAYPMDLSNEVTSGVAVGDFDNDGFTDVFMAVARGTSCQPVLLRNLGNDNRSVTIRLVGTVSNRDAIGARVEVSAGDLRQMKGVYAGSSTLSMDSQWLTFGLAKHESTDRVKVTWPLGLVEVFPNLAAGQTVTLVEGQGTVETAGPELIGVVDAAGDTWISPLGESVGLSSFRIEASEALQLRGDPQVVVTGGATPVVSLVSEGDGVHVVELAPAPEPGQWVKITLPVTGEVSGGEADLTVWVAHHPGDLNQDGNVNISDATALGEGFRTQGSTALLDLNRDGVVNVRDATAFGGIWFGTESTRSWNGSRLPDRP